MRYSVKLAKDDNGTFLVTSRDFPELVTFGETMEDAFDHAREAIEEAIAARLAAGRPIPIGRAKRSFVVVLPPDIELKLRLNHIVVNLGSAKAAVARVLGLHRPQLDRLLDIRHETRSSDLLAAFDRLGYAVSYRISVAALRRAARLKRRLRRRAKLGLSARRAALSLAKAA